MSQLTAKFSIVLATALVMTSAVNAGAHSNDARLDEQAALIEQGRRDGSITWREGRELREQQREIVRVKEAFEADGRLSRNEKRVLYKMQEGTEISIEQEANDNSHRASWLPRFGH